MKPKQIFAVYNGRKYKIYFAGLTYLKRAKGGREIMTDVYSAGGIEQLTTDDETIISLYFKRSETAISETAKKYGSYLLKIALNILNNREDSDECVNDTYMKTWNAIPPEHPKKLLAFLARITRNLSLNKYKARNAGKRGGNELALLLSELEDCIKSGSDVETEFESGLVSKAVSEFLLSVDKESRIIFARRYWYADPVSEIAARLNISVGKVKSNLFRTRNKLRVYLEKEGISL